MKQAIDRMQNARQWPFNQIPNTTMALLFPHNLLLFDHLLKFALIMLTTIIIQEALIASSAVQV